MDIKKLELLVSPTLEQQTEVLKELKEIKILELDETEKSEVINFICDKVSLDLSIDYLFHVLDNEISYPIDDEKVKTLFSDARMIKLKELMVEKLQEDEVSEDEVSDGNI